MKNHKEYPLFKVHVDKRAAMSVLRDVLNSGYINEGQQVSDLTSAMRKFFGTDRLVLTNSCTSALTLALQLSNVKPYDEVVSTPMTCVATNAPIVNMGAMINWADIDPNTGCIDVNSVRERFKENPNIKAVIAVAWAGIPPQLNDLRNVCNEHGARLILDAAHAFGAKYDSEYVDASAHYTCYSLQAIKHMTSGDGGILVINTLNDDNDFKRAKCLKWFGIDRDLAKDESGNWRGQHWDFDIVEAGHKFNMNNISAAIGLSQLKHIDSILQTHRTNASMYEREFSLSDYVTTLHHQIDSDPSYWVYTILLKNEYAHIRDKLLKSLNDEGIKAGLVHVPNDEYTCFQQYKRNLPGVREFSKRQLSLPVGWWLSKRDIKHILTRFNDLCKQLLVI